MPPEESDQGRGVLWCHISRTGMTTNTRKAAQAATEPGLLLVALRNLSNVARDLCIATQVVNELAVRSAEEPFAD